MSDFSYYDVERAFEHALEDAGCPPADGEKLILDGVKHLCRVAGEKKKGKRLQYCVYVDDSPAGYFLKYGGASSVPYTTWLFKTDSVKSLSPEERKSLIEKHEAERAKREQQEELERSIAIAKVKRDWSLATPANPMHPYALKKGLHDAHGARLLGNELLVPVQTVDCELISIQKLTASGKYFNDKAQINGNFSVLSDVKDEKYGMNVIPQSVEGPVWVCEGWATGCSIREATNQVVVVSFNAGNLAKVIEALRERRPDLELAVAADNDWAHQNGNTGMSVATKIFDRYGIPYAAPDFTDEETKNDLTDWNDFANARGLTIAGRLLDSKLAKMKKEPKYELFHSRLNFVHVNMNTGRPLGTIENLEALLAYRRIKIGYNEIKKEEVMEIPGRTYCGDNAVNAALGFIYSACAEYGLPKADIDVFITEIASRNIINPVKDWILSEPWDGGVRFDVLADSLHLQDPFPKTFRNVLLRRWLTSAVAAAFERGEFRSRGTLVLQGPQGIGKTTWFRRMVGGHRDWFAENLTIDPANKDILKISISHWIVEAGELEGTFKKADLARLKGHLTAPKDIIRVPYGKRDNAYQRRTVYCGTVNQREFLMDSTGNGRFWCVPVQKIDKLEGFDYQQLWAEVYERFYLSKDHDLHSWWLTDAEDKLLDEQNWQFEAPDPIEDLIKSKLNWESYKETWREKTATEVLLDCGIMYPNKGQAMTASRVLRKMTGAPSKRDAKGSRRVFLVPDKLDTFYAV